MKLLSEDNSSSKVDLNLRRVNRAPVSLETQAVAITANTTASPSPDDAAITLNHSRKSSNNKTTQPSAYDNFINSSKRSVSTSKASSSAAPSSPIARSTPPVQLSRDLYKYKPHQFPVPHISSRPSQTSPSYGRWHIDSTVFDKHEFYILVASRPQVPKPKTDSARSSVQSLAPPHEARSSRSRRTSVAFSTAATSHAASETDSLEYLEIPVEDIKRYVSAAEFEAFELREHRRRTADEEEERLREIQEVAQLTRAQNHTRHGGTSLDSDANIVIGTHAGVKRSSTAASDGPAAKKQKFSGVGPGGHWRIKREMREREAELKRQATKTPKTAKGSKASSPSSARSKSQSKASSVAPTTIIWEVESILADWTDEKTGDRFYTVKWVGSNELTEEPEHHLDGLELLAEYHQARKAEAADKDAMDQALVESMNAYSTHQDSERDELDSTIYADHDSGEQSTPRGRHKAFVGIKSVSASPRRPSPLLEDSVDEDDDSGVGSSRNTSPEQPSVQTNGLRKSAPTKDRTTESDAEMLPDKRDVDVAGIDSDEDLDETNPKSALTTFMNGASKEDEEVSSPKNVGGALAAFKAAFTRQR